MSIGSETTGDDEEILDKESSRILNEELSPKRVVKLQKILEDFNENQEEEKDEDAQEITPQLNSEPHLLNKRHMYGPPPPPPPPTPRYGYGRKTCGPPAKSYGSKKCYETDDSKCDNYSCKKNKCHTGNNKKPDYNSCQCSEESDENSCGSDCNKRNHNHDKGYNNRNNINSNNRNNKNNNKNNNRRKKNKNDDDDDYGMYW